MNKERFFIATRGNDDEAYREAIQYACKLADEDIEIKKVILLVHTQKHTNRFKRIFDKEIEKQLFKGIALKNCKPVFKIETKRTYYDSYTPSEIVITCGLDSNNVFFIDDFYSVKAIIAIPWLANDLDKWVRTWEPTEIRGNQQAVSAYSEPTCIIKKAMQDLTNSINMSTGISNPSDEEQAKTYILALHEYENFLDANIISAYLIRELNWETDYAKDIEKLINTLNSGKYFQGGKRTGLQNYYKQWKKECGQ